MEEKNEFEVWEKRLNKIVERLENENLTISEIEKLYEEGAELIKKCNSNLDDLKGKIVKIDKEIDGSIIEKKLFN